MDFGALKAIVEHDGRLDVLCCILDGGPLSVLQISARTGGPAVLVDHWLKLLCRFKLVEEVANPGGEGSLYAVTLDDHPDWVREAIEDHRRA